MKLINVRVIPNAKKNDVRITRFAKSREKVVEVFTTGVI